MENKRKIHKIKVIREDCVSAATCVVIAPDAFDLDEDGIAIIKPDALKLDDETILMATKSCPTDAILLFDGNDNQLYP